jgi:hypothetical protein
MGNNPKKTTASGDTVVSMKPHTDVGDAAGAASGALKTIAAGVTIRNAKTGQFVTVKGAGALKGSSFKIKKGVDLTKPIARQALRGASKLTG